MNPSRSLRERLHEARAALADVAPADGPLVAPVLAQIERALARIAGEPPVGGVEITGIASLGGAAPRNSLHEELERLTPSGERSGLLDAVLNQSPHGILIADVDGRLILQNPAAERIWAGSAAAQDVEGWGQYRAFHPDGRPFEARDWSMAKSLSEGTVNEAREIHFLRFDGTHGYMIGSSAPIFGAEKRVIGAVSVFADITEMKRVEETLRVTEQQLSTMLRSIGDAVISTDPAGHVTFLNEVAESLTGWSIAEARGAPLDQVFNIVNETTRERVESPVAKVIREGKIVDLANHTILLRRNGTEASIDDSAAPIRDSRGDLAGVVLIFRDITRRRREEERTAFLADIASHLVESSLDYESRLARVARLAVPRLADWAAIDMLGADGGIRRVAVAHVDPHKIEHIEALERRYPPDHSQPNGVAQIIRTGKSEIVREITDEMLTASVHDPEQLQLVRQIGLRSYISVPLTVDGTTFGAITFATAETNRLFEPDDLAFAEEIARRAAIPIHNARLFTEAREARALAEAAETRFRSLAEAIPQIVWATDGAGENEYISPRWHQYTGQAPDLPLSELWRQALHPEDYDECIRTWEAAARSGSSWQVEYRIRRADGVYRWHLGRSVPLIEEGRVVKWYGTATDINEQKRAIRTRDEILATVSHDLRNPLGNILLSAELLEEEGLEQDPGLVESIKRAANRMSTLIRDLLDITAVEGGELSLHRRPVQIGPLVAEAVFQQQQLARQKRVTLSLVPSEVDVVLLCDQDRILQVFANLIGNALKFTPIAGAITVSYRIVGDDMALTVADTGPGIPAQLQKKVFDRFWRDKESVNSGSGLGLAICRGIVEQHGGRIWVEGGEGQGATFAFTLPLRTALEREIESEKALAKP
ncbi:MAG: PAS domain S-box protein [Byssovorax sp.]